MPKRVLRSFGKNFLQVKRPTTKFYGTRFFIVAAATKWNRLPQNIQSESVTIFKSRLKTYLFCHAGLLKCHHLDLECSCKHVLESVYPLDLCIHINFVYLLDLSILVCKGEVLTTAPLFEILFFICSVFITKDLKFVSAI